MTNEHDWRLKLDNNRLYGAMTWRNNVRIVKCTDGTFIRPCTRCCHPFGEHNMIGDCLVCIRAGTFCGVKMHETWPDLVPVSLDA